MNRELGFGLVGCGMIARFHIKALAEIAGTCVVALVDSVSGAAERLAADVKLPAGCYSDLGLFLKHPGLDVVVVCTPSGAHLEPAVAAAEARKHVVVEKPLEIT